MAETSDVQRHIEALVAEEHGLFETASERALDDAEKRRMKAIEVELDRYYDLLRQRRAREEFGQDPDAAHVRSESTVETYLQ